MSLCFSQTSKGTIAGVVRDISGAVIPNAQVNASSDTSGEVRNVTTDANGGYIIPALTPGTYTLTMTGPGFSLFKVAGVEVKASSDSTVNGTLKVAVRPETVDVIAGAAQNLDTINGALADNIATAEVENLPVSTLNPIELVLTEPGIQPVAGRDNYTNGVAFSANGARPRANNFLIDSFDNNDSGVAGQAFQPLNLEAVSEITILKNSYAAEYGRGSGSVTNVIYKGGSNQFHGSLWELFQSSALQATKAQDLVNGLPKAPSHENTYGFSFGGPILKNKLFFFASTEWDKTSESANGPQLLLPTANGVAALESLGTNANVNYLLNAMGNLRGQSNSAGTTAIALGPDPVTGAMRPNVEVGPTARTGVGVSDDVRQFSIRTDYLPTQKDNLMVRYLIDDNRLSPDLFANPYALPGFDTMQSGRSQNLAIAYTHTFSSNLTNEFRFSYGRINLGFLPTSETLANPLANEPSALIDELSGVETGIMTGFPQSRLHNTFQTQEALNWTKGNHTWKFGLDLTRIQEFDLVPFNSRGTVDFAAGGGYTGLANFVDNYSGAGYSNVAIQFGNPKIRPFVFNQGYYAQDTWRVRPNLTLTLGVRYEYAGTPLNVLPYPTINPATVLTDPIETRVLEKADKNNWAPRVSFAYSPQFWRRLFGENKTVIRGGYGIFYDMFFDSMMAQTATSVPNVLGGTLDGGDPSSRGIFNPFGALHNIAPMLDPTSARFAIANNLVSPMTHQWNLNIQRELPGNVVLTTAYVGTRGEHLYGRDQANPGYLGSFTRLNPDQGSITLFDNSGDSIYHGLDVKVDRRFSKGLLLRAAYTWSKMIDNGSEVFLTSGWSSYRLNPFDPTSDRGLSAFDRRQRLVLSYVYDIPKLPPHDALAYKAIRQVLGDWQISGTTAFTSGAPETVALGYDFNGDTVASDRPNLGNPTAPITAWGFYGATINTFYGTNLPATQLYDGNNLWFNGNLTPVSASSMHWTVPVSGYGNVGRNTIINPGSQDWTFSIARNFKMPFWNDQSSQFQFRTEMFNPFNHPNEGNGPTSNINYTLTQPNFANAYLSRYGGREIRFWLRYSF